MNHGTSFLSPQLDPVRLLNVDTPKDRLAVALDFPSAQPALDLVDRLSGTCHWFKVGMELYYAAGNSLVETLRNRGFNVFLDLKLHDIPNTVAGAVRSATQAGASLLTIHAGGGPAMMTAAAEAAAAPGSPRLLAVTVLTSMDAHELTRRRCHSSPPPNRSCASPSWRSSPESTEWSAPLKRSARCASELGAETLLVIPGIRPQAARSATRNASPPRAAAIERGASMLVVGRPITRAADPAQAAESILKEIEQASRLEIR